MVHRRRGEHQWVAGQKKGNWKTALPGDLQSSGWPPKWIYQLYMLLGFGNFWSAAPGIKKPSPERKDQQRWKEAHNMCLIGPNLAILLI